VQEVAVILAKWSEQNTLAVAVKDTFPGAVVSDVKPTMKDKLDDKIPF
jgi:carbohydrate-binding DOMON domain-containing protein